MPLQVPEMKKLPTLACLGYVKDVGQPKINDNTGTITIPIEIEAMEQGRGRKYSFCYRQEMLDSGFDPSEADTGAEFLYRKNLVDDGSDDADVSALRAMTGDAYEEVTEELIAVNGRGAEGVAEVLRERLLGLAEDGLKFGYILRQQYDKTGEVDDNGRAIKKPTKWYEVGAFANPTEKVRERWAKRAKRATKDKPFILTFET